MIEFNTYFDLMIKRYRYAKPWTSINKQAIIYSNLEAILSTAEA